MNNSNIKNKPLCTPPPAIDLVTKIYKDLYNEPYKYFDENEQPIGTRGQMIFVRQLVKAVEEQGSSPESRYTTVPGWKAKQDANIADQSTNTERTKESESKRVTHAEAAIKREDDNKYASLIDAMEKLTIKGGRRSRARATTKRRKSTSKTRNKSRLTHRTKSHNKIGNKKRNKTRR